MIRLVIDFSVERPHEREFEAMYRDVYVVALKKQQGFLGSSLCKSYPDDVLAEFGAEKPAFNYRMTLDFDSEAARRTWVASEDHDPAWTQATALATKYAYVGYDVVAQA